MRLQESSKLFLLHKSTYINLRWIAYAGQLSAILIVQFFLEYKFNYFSCISVIFVSVLTNLYLQFKIKENQLINLVSTGYLAFDIIHTLMGNDVALRKDFIVSNAINVSNLDI